MKKFFAWVITIAMVMTMFGSVTGSVVQAASVTSPDPEVLTSKINMPSKNVLGFGEMDADVFNLWRDSNVGSYVTDSIEGSGSLKAVPSGNWQGIVGGQITPPSITNDQVYKFTVCFKLLNANSVGHQDDDQLIVGWLDSAARITINKRSFGEYNNQWVRVVKYLDSSELTGNSREFQVHGNKSGKGNPIEVLIDAVSLEVLSIDEAKGQEPTPGPAVNPYDQNYSSAQKVTVNVNANKKYQALEGLGFFGSMGSLPNGQIYNNDWIDMIIDDMGVSVIREELSPFSLDAGSGKADFEKHIAYAKALKDKSASRGFDIKLILTVWSPPGKFKDNGKPIEGGKLLTSKYQDYANWLIDCLDEYKKAGVDVYALSLQNEPNFPEPYNSCVYSPQEYAALLKNVVPTVKNSYPNIKIYGSENMFGWEGDPNHWEGQRYHIVIQKDAEALKNIDAFAGHGYVDGVTATAVNKHKALWEYTVQTYSKPTWMTETSGYRDDWLVSGSEPGAFDYGLAIGSALRYGNSPLWCHWSGSEIGSNAQSTFSLMDGMKYGKRYIVSKHYYRFIRPGDVRIETTSSDNTLLNVGFKDESTGDETFVLMNNSNKDKIISLSGCAADKYSYFVTTDEKNTNCFKVENVSKGEIRVPAMSIVTVTNQEDLGGTGVVPTPGTQESPKPSETPSVSENEAVANGGFEDPDGDGPEGVSSGWEDWNCGVFENGMFVTNPGNGGTVQKVAIKNAVPGQKYILKAKVQLVAAETDDANTGLKFKFNATGLNPNDETKTIENEKFVVTLDDSMFPQGVGSWIEIEQEVALQTADECIWNSGDGNDGATKFEPLQYKFGFWAHDGQYAIDDISLVPVADAVSPTPGTDDPEEPAAKKKLKKPTIKKIKSTAKKTVKVTLKKKIAGAKKFQVKMATKKSFKKAKTVKVKAKKVFKVKHKLLKKGKKIWFKVRALKTSKKKASSFSKPKKYKIKK